MKLQYTRSYCRSTSNVFYSSLLRGFDDMHCQVYSLQWLDFSEDLLMKLQRLFYLRRVTLIWWHSFQLSFRISIISYTHAKGFSYHFWGEWFLSFISFHINYIELRGLFIKIHTLFSIPIVHVWQQILNNYPYIHVHPSQNVGP